MSVRRNDRDHGGSEKKGEPERPNDPTTVFGLIYRAITDSKVLTRLFAVRETIAGQQGQVAA